VQKVRWEVGGTDLTGEYTFLYEKRNNEHEVVTGFLVHKTFVSAIKRVDFVSDRMSYIILRGSGVKSLF
jgi:hypothetical protein